MRKLLRNGIKNDLTLPTFQTGPAVVPRTEMVKTACHLRIELWREKPRVLCGPHCVGPWGYEVGADRSTGEYMTLGWAGDVNCGDIRIQMAFRAMSFSAHFQTKALRGGPQNLQGNGVGREEGVKMLSISKPQSPGQRTPYTQLHRHISLWDWSFPL